MSAPKLFQHIFLSFVGFLWCTMRFIHYFRNHYTIHFTARGKLAVCFIDDAKKPIFFYLIAVDL